MSGSPVAVIAMSGGVDSSVAAGILKENGFSVVGMMLRLWSELGNEESNRCCTPDSVAQARRVAAILDFPLYVLDARELFRNTIVQNFIDGYRSGATPNPCVLCNKVMRWGHLLQQAKEIGAEYLATGHYARLRISDYSKIQLTMGIDREKDQSYVLSRLDQDQLAHTLFPLGEMTKQQTREFARRMKLPVANRPDSQDLCFLPDKDYRPFLERYAPEVGRKGQIVDSNGKVLGEHAGLAFYTIGQRKGLKIASPQPLYVIDKEMDQNLLIVGTAEKLGSNTFRVGQMNWIAGSQPGDSFEAQVKIRYKSPLVDCRVAVDGDVAHVELNRFVRDVTPGQLAVFYEGEIVLGSGIIHWR